MPKRSCEDKVQMEDVQANSPSRTLQPEKKDGELTRGLQEDTVPEDVSTRCSVCDFLAKCPRSLKIHYARKHKKSADKAAKFAEDNQTISDDSRGEVQKEMAMETEGSAVSNPGPGPDDPRSVSPDDSCSQVAMSEKQSKQAISIQERRMSKRTPKPKIIYSCNYCGLEFRDKSPLDVHVQRYHSKDSPRTVDAEEYMEEEENVEDTESAFKITTSQVEPKCTGNRFKIKCANCDLRVSTLCFLESHARIKHPGLDWYRCKLCNFFSATSQWMDKHLNSDIHKQHQSTEHSASHSSNDCVERVAKGDGGGDDIGGEALGIQEEMEAAKVADEEDLEPEPPKPKRGRPKQQASTKCGYCGLVVSNATNLSVHVRRKHSKEYVYKCTLCSYSCVTKGDIDRHCITKKHRKRVQQCENSSPVKNNAGPLLQEPTDTQSQGANEASEARDMQHESLGSKKHTEEEQTLSYTPPIEGHHDSFACSHCNFIAHSVPSLNLHVKRKHSRDFEYVCLACRYYAVTSEEMSRHASTERHKQKSKTFQALQENGGQKALQTSTVPPTDLIDLSGAMVHPESEPLKLPDDPNLNSEESQKEKKQPTVASSLPVEPVDTVAMFAGKAKEKQPESTASSSGDDCTVGKTAQSEHVPQAEMALEVEQSPQKEIQEQEDTCIEGTSTEKSCSSVPRMSTARPFDTCIMSVKALAEQGHPSLEGVALEGVAAVKGLTGEALMPSGLLPQYVKKLEHKEVSVEAKVRNARIRCDDCGFLADGLSGLNVHISMKHPTKDKHFHCMVCGKSFYTESNLHQHLASASHIRNEQNSVDERLDGGACFKCAKCTDRFETEQELFNHIKEKHDELLRQVNKYVIEDTEQINREREEHQGNKCKYCGKVCKSSNSMAFLAHIRTHTGSKPFLCKICHFATAQLGDARNHVKRHLGMREYRCDICGWAFVMKKHLSTHLLGKHGIGQRKERKFECKLCERSFSEKWALNNHLKLHSGEKPYKCSWPSCHYAFLNLSAMKDHYRTHTGEKTFLCDLCGFAGGTRHALTKHRRQHTGERPFKCKLCNFASTTQSHLSRHNRVHTGEKPYRCPWCEYRSNCAENIRKHILHTGKHEGVKMYNCPKCDYGTNSPIEFRNHLKDRHPDIENPDLAYLHAGIVSKAFECRLKGQGASFVEMDVVESSVDRKLGNEDDVQQVIIIQGYSDGEVAVDQTLEESAAATLQTLAMAGQVAEVLHITEDGQVIASGREVASAGAQLARGGARYVVLSAGEAANELQAAALEAGEDSAAAGKSHVLSESSTALDALLSVVSEMGQQEKMHEEASAAHEVAAPETVEPVESDVQPVIKQEEEVQVINQAGQEEMQNLLQLAASRMIKEGLTQVIVNDEGTHYIVTELDNCTLQVEGGVYEEAAVDDP